MTAERLEGVPELVFLCSWKGMIGAGWLRCRFEQWIDIPGQIGLAGLNGFELLQGLPRQLATMDACRLEIGRKAAEIVAAQLENPDADLEKHVTLSPKISYGDTLRRR